MLHAVIMAGGAGTRFWPASRVNRPKQLLNLTGSQSMIQATVQRLGDLVTNDRLLVVTNERLVEPIRRQLPDLPPASILGEPCKRDTAPCVGLAAAILVASDPDATMLVMPADHVIQQADEFRRAISFGHELLQEDPQRIITFGIRPTYPAEIFGYIERADKLASNVEPAGRTIATYRVRQFREKPSADVAQQYLAAGNFYWNSGIFLWQAQTILNALKEFEPEIYQHIARIAQSVGEPDFADVLACEFAAIQGKSIDYAVMERYDNVVVMEAPFDWDDVGSWQSLARLHGQDEAGNTCIGSTLSIRTENTIICSSEDHLVATVGLDNVIVVHTDDATLVMRRDDEEAVRQVVQSLQQNKRTEFL